MIIYNVVLEVNTEIEADFMEWIRKKHIPLIISTGCFIGFKLSKQIVPKPDGKFTAVCRFFCRNQNDFDDYVNRYIEAMRRDFPARFINKYTIVRTVEEI